jgi:hypothetical protein
MIETAFARVLRELARRRITDYPRLLRLFGRRNRNRIYAAVHCGRRRGLWTGGRGGIELVEGARCPLCGRALGKG